MAELALESVVYSEVVVTRHGGSGRGVVPNRRGDGVRDQYYCVQTIIRSYQCEQKGSRIRMERGL